MLIESPLNFRQGLTSFLHFRQCKLPKLGNRGELEVRNSWVFADARQRIASRCGKEMLQVTLCRPGNLLVPMGSGKLLLPLLKYLSYRVGIHLLTSKPEHHHAE